MKFLIDTNILIPMEPVSVADIKSNTDMAVTFVKNVTTLGYQVYLHPDQKIDIRNDKDHERRALRELQFGKYPLLPDPPQADVISGNVLGNPPIGSHDWVDNQLIVALSCDSVDYLITEDKGIHRKAERLNLNTRVASLSEGISIVQGLFDSTPTPPPAIRQFRAHSLNMSDPIFTSLRADYDGFDAWLKKCRLEHRQAWVINLEGQREYAGLCIVNREEDTEFLPPGKSLKICTFKVSDKCFGIRLGELLLKTVLGHGFENHYDSIFVEVFPKQTSLIDLFSDFGFKELESRTKRDELRLFKHMNPQEADGTCHDPLDFNIRYGPFHIDIENAPIFVIPIQPKYHGLLFPEAESQLELFPGRQACGNSIRKAYLCHSRLKKMTKGATLLFYRSHDLQALTVFGVAEDYVRSPIAVQIARFVGKRTVYTYDEIQSMCSTSDVMAILFGCNQPPATPPARILT